MRKSYTPEQIISKLRDELLNREISTTLTEAKIMNEYMLLPLIIKHVIIILTSQNSVGLQNQIVYRKEV